MFDADAWKKTSLEQDNTNDGPPQPGEYEIEITSGKFFTSKAGNDVITLGMRVTRGDDAGYEWTELRGMASQGQMKAAKATCSRLGIDVDDIKSGDALDQALKACVGRYYSVRVVQNGDYRNVYINERVTAHQDAITGDWRQEAASATTVDDDVPF